MTKDDILRMGREAGMHDPMIFIGAYERFANLVAALAAEREPEAERKWVGLTAEDLAQIESDEFWQVGNHMAIALAVEDKLKEKNI